MPFEQSFGGFLPRQKFKIDHSFEFFRERYLFEGPFLIHFRWPAVTRDKEALLYLLILKFDENWEFLRWVYMQQNIHN